MSPNGQIMGSFALIFLLFNQAAAEWGGTRASGQPSLGSAPYFGTPGKPLNKLGRLVVT